MPVNITIDGMVFGFPTAKEYSGGIKKKTTREVEMKVAARPPRRPPIQELKNTAG
jgi:hypothetical protein